MDYLRERLAAVRSRHGEDAFSTRMLRQQIAALEREPESAAVFFMTAPGLAERNAKEEMARTLEIIAVTE
jgi:hypothetical protein